MRRLLELAQRRRGSTVVVVGVVAVSSRRCSAAAGSSTDYGALLVGTAVALAAAGLSLNLLMGYAGQISLGHASLVGVGAFTTGATHAGDRARPAVQLAACPPPPSRAPAVAFVIGLPALRLRGLYLAVVTIAFTLRHDRIDLRVGGDRRRLGRHRPAAAAHQHLRSSRATPTTSRSSSACSPPCGGSTPTSPAPRSAGPSGRCKSDEAVAASFGVDVTRYKLLAFALSGAMAGIAGVMAGHLSLHGEQRVVQLRAARSAARRGRRRSVAREPRRRARRRRVLRASIRSSCPKLFGDRRPRLRPGRRRRPARVHHGAQPRRPGRRGARAAPREARREAARRGTRPHAASTQQGDARATEAAEHAAARVAGVTAGGDRRRPVLEAEDITVRFGGLAGGRRRVDQRPSRPRSSG